MICEGSTGEGKKCRRKKKPARTELMSGRDGLDKAVCNIRTLENIKDEKILCEGAKRSRGSGEQELGKGKIVADPE